MYSFLEASNDYFSFFLTLADCKYNCHKKCSEFVAKDCTGNPSANHFFLGTSDDGESKSEVLLNSYEEL